MAGNTGNEKGAELERRVGRLEFADGALVRLRWPVCHQVHGRRRMITDIDVLSIDFDSRLQPTISIIECKSVRGQAGEQDRLFWLSGLKTMLGAGRAVLVRESVTAAGRDLSRRLGIDLLGGRELERREADHQWIPQVFGRIGNGPGASELQTTINQLKNIGDIRAGLVAFLRYDALVADPHRTLGALVTLADITHTGTVLPEPAGKVVAADAMTALLLAALRAAGRLDSLGSDGVRREIEDGLTTGDPHDRHVLKVVDIADALLREQLSQVHRAYVESGARPLELSYPSLREVVASTPSWLPRFMDLAERCRSRTTIATQLLQVSDLVLYDALAGGVSWQAAAFDHLFTPQHRQLLLVCFDVFSLVAPHLACRLKEIQDIRFDRTSAPVPDRRGHPSVPKNQSQAGSPGIDDMQDQDPLIPRSEISSDSGDTTAAETRSVQPVETMESTINETANHN